MIGPPASSISGSTRRSAGVAQPYDDYCLELIAAREGRFAHLPATGSTMPISSNSGLYAAFLRRMAEADGTSGSRAASRASSSTASGDVAALALEGGNRIEGDLFLDCTGFRALLIDGALHAGFDDLDPLAALRQRDRAPDRERRPCRAPSPRAMAHDAGWQWRIPLQHRTGNGIVWCSRYLRPRGGAGTTARHRAGQGADRANHLKFAAGARRKQWHRNVVAIELSSRFMEPLESTSIHLIQRAVIRLLRMMPLWPRVGA
ncbi:tryptophan 7-halogenase [Sphingomonas sp. MMS24-JH45]